MAWFFKKAKREEAASVEEQPSAELLEADVIVSDTQSDLDSEIDFTDFWYDNRESMRNHVSLPPTEKDIANVEAEFGHKLPKSYIQLMQMHNGGLVNRCRYRVKAPVAGCPDTIYITDILGISDDAPYSILGKFGSRFLTETRHHNPDIGIAICNTTLPGRALVFLDYRDCGESGEPKITWADAQQKQELTLAKNFNEFIKNLEINTVER